MADVLIKDEASVRWITLNRPETRNALTTGVNDSVREAVASAPAAGVRVVVLTGAGGAFSSGLDLRVAAEEGMDPEHIESRMRTHFHGLIRVIRACPLPTLAVVDGPAAGFGCDLALACDLRLVSDRARFGEIFVKRGLMPDGGGTWMLPRLIGLGRALELMLTGDLVEAVEAHRIGLANRIYPAQQLESSARDFARTLAMGPPLVHRAVKAAVAAASHSTLDEALEGEVRGQLKLLASADFQEGIVAFLEKRPPAFKGD